MSKTKCPLCFRFLPETTQQYVCVGSCSSTRSDVASAARGHETHLKPILDANGASHVTCPRCQTSTEQEVCPACLGEIPPNWRTALVTCVAMSGARATGKSLMIAAAKAQLELLVERHHRSALQGIGATERIFYDTYTRRLYEERQLLPPTPSIGDEQPLAREPLMFGFTETRPDGTRQARVLVFRDVAGEDLEALGERDMSLTSTGTPGANANPL